MIKTMKPSTIKTVVVRLTADNVNEFSVDVDIFDDPFMEAATRAVEKSKEIKRGIIRPVIECWEKNDPKRSYLYNSYWVLVNAACYKKAELLRDKFKMQYDHDLALEPKNGSKSSKS
jgi:hypothetical protein